MQHGQRVSAHELASGTPPRPLHPINAVLRFALELVALAALGRWGFMLSTRGVRYVWMLAAPLTAAALWGTFTVPADPSRGSTGPVRVSGLLRLALEAGFFGCACWALERLGQRAWASTLAVAVGVHYVWARERTRWLLQQRGSRFWRG
jgi:hypothetical protein